LHSTKIFFATDIHGSEACFRKFVNAAKFFKANALILGGDLTGKMIVPVVKCPDGTFKARLFGQERVAKNESEMNNLVKIISSVGFYPYNSSSSETEELNDPTKLDGLFKEIVLETLRRWVGLAEQRLKDTGVKCYIQAGNDDIKEVDQILNDSDYIINTEGKIIDLDDHHEMISTGFANITPWNCPRDVPEDVLIMKIEGLVEQVSNLENCIFNFHCPPFDTELDLAPALDENLNVIMKTGSVIYSHVGSKTVRNAITKYAPLLGLHGHIHESRGTYRIGRTLCINPGSEYTEGILRGVILNLNEKGLQSYQLTAG